MVSARGPPATGANAVQVAVDVAAIAGDGARVQLARASNNTLLAVPSGGWG